MSTAIEFIEADWPAPRGIVAGTTTRRGGVSAGVYASLNLGGHVGDKAENVIENRRRFLAQCRLPAEPLWLTQVHGTTVIVNPSDRHNIAADAILATSSDTVCAVMTADCLPVLLVSTNAREFAAAHAGWRGLCHGVLERTVQSFAAPAGEILAWLGPAISQQNFEVGDDVRQAFIERRAAAGECFIANDRDRWQADLYGLARQRLAGAGVLHVYGGGACTYGDAERFFSFRRDGECGRMASFVFRMDESR